MKRFYGRARTRKLPGAMNKLERAYADELGLRQAAGEIQEWLYEAVTLKLAHDTRYTPDFFVVTRDGDVEFHETKGGLFRDDAKVKIKVAAARFPFRFVLVRREGSDWQREEVAA
jgi:hypothetical protein